MAYNSKISKEDKEELDKIDVHTWKNQTKLLESLTNYKLMYILELADQLKRSNSIWYKDMDVRISGTKQELCDRIKSLKEPPPKLGTFKDIEVSEELNNTLNRFYQWCQENHFTLFKNHPHKKYHMLKIEKLELKNIIHTQLDNNEFNLQQFLDILMKNIQNDEWLIFPSDDSDIEEFDDSSYQSLINYLSKK